MVSSILQSLFGRRSTEQTSQQWADLSRRTGNLSESRRQALRSEATQKRQDIDRFLMLSDPARDGSDLEELPFPAGTDWKWRPSVFTGVLSKIGLSAPDSGSYMAPDLVVWHDIPDNMLSLRQVLRSQQDGLPPFGIQLDSFAPRDQGYIALTFDLPPEAIADLDRNFVLRVMSVTGAAISAQVYLRLNVEHGPNIEQEVRNLDKALDGKTVSLITEFDLGFVEMNPRRLQKIWLDVIVERPDFNAFALRDLVISRHLRADM